MYPVTKKEKNNKNTETNLEMNQQRMKENKNGVEWNGKKTPGIFLLHIFARRTLLSVEIISYFHASMCVFVCILYICVRGERLCMSKKFLPDYFFRFLFFF